jgi:hypothetical protein
MAAKKAPKKSATKKPAAKKAAKKAGAKKAAAKKSAKTARIPDRADKGDGEAAVQARIKALSEPSRSMITKLHALVKKHAPDLEPTVRWGFAVYSRGGKMLVVASPYTKYARLGFTKDAGVKGAGDGYIEYANADQIDEAKVAALLQQLSR